jgi:integrase
MRIDSRRIGAALNMKVEDPRPRSAGWTTRLHEKGGKQHTMPCHHSLAEALRAYIDAAGLAEDRKGWLFLTSSGHNGDALYPIRPWISPPPGA